MKRNFVTAETARKALELRRVGTSYRDIAHQLDISLGHAHDLVRRELADVPAADRIALRDLEAERLDMLQAIVWPQARTGDLAAIKECRVISESRRKLFGLDAPQQVEMPGVEKVDIMGTAQNIFALIQDDESEPTLDGQSFDGTSEVDEYDAAHLWLREADGRAMLAFRGSDNVQQLRPAPSVMCEPAVVKPYPCAVLAPQCPEGLTRVSVRHELSHDTGYVGALCVRNP